MTTAQTESDRQAKWDELVKRYTGTRDSRYADFAKAELELIDMLRGRPELVDFVPGMAMLAVVLVKEDTAITIVPEGTETYGISVDVELNLAAMMDTLKRMFDHLRRVEYAIPADDSRYHESMAPNAAHRPTTWHEIAERLKQSVLMKHPNHEEDQAMLDLLPEIKRAADLLEVQPRLGHGILVELHLPDTAAYVSIMNRFPSQFEASKAVIVPIDEIVTAVLDFAK